MPGNNLLPFTRGAHRRLLIRSLATTRLEYAFLARRFAFLKMIALWLVILAGTGQRSSPREARRSSLVSILGEPSSIARTYITPKSKSVLRQ